MLLTTSRNSSKNVLVLDLETAPDPMALRMLPARERSKTTSTAVHRIVTASLLQAEESEEGIWSISSLTSIGGDIDLPEEDILRHLDQRLAALHRRGGTMVTFNGRRHDLVVIKMRAAAHLAFDLPGIAAIPAINHLDLMTTSIASGGQWFKLRDIAAGLQIPINHQIASPGLGIGNKAARKGEVDVAATFLVFLYDLASTRRGAGAVVEGWRALGRYVRTAGLAKAHLAQFRRHALGLGPND